MGTSGVLGRNSTVIITMTKSSGELRPEFIRRVRRIEKEGKFKEYSSLSELRKEIRGCATK